MKPTFCTRRLPLRGDEHDVVPVPDREVGGSAEDRK